LSGGRKPLELDIHPSFTTASDSKLDKDPSVLLALFKLPSL